MVNIENMNSEPRSDAVLLNLSNEHKEKLREALLDGMSYNANPKQSSVIHANPR